jgi:hypothetical protein
MTATLTRSTVSTPRDVAIKENFEAFEHLLPSILIAHTGKVALLRDRKVCDYFDTPSEAIRSGHKQFPDRMFSVQRVERSTVDLGWYSHV